MPIFNLAILFTIHSIFYASHAMISSFWLD